MAPTATGIAESGVDPYSDEFLADTHQGFQDLRELGPVVYLPVHDVYALPRYDEVRAALTDFEHFSSASGVGLNDYSNGTPSILHMDPPMHTGSRKFLLPPLSPAGLRDVSAEIDSTAEALAAELLERGSFDGVTDLAQKIPLMIVARLVGLPESGRERMLQWGTDGFNGTGPEGYPRTQQGQASIMEVFQYLETEVSPETVVPGSWAAQVFERAEQASIPPEVAKGLILTYVFPSLDTTIQAMSNLVWLFGNHPEQWDLLRERPELINRAINESLRVESPVTTFTRRIIGGDKDFAGTVLPDGARVLVMFASANRDERKWEDPERFDITREGSEEHLAFGFGVHQCLGQGLARLEIRALLKALIPRIERFEIGDHQRILNNSLRGFSSLDVRVR